MAARGPQREKTLTKREGERKCCMGQCKSRMGQCKSRRDSTKMWAAQSGGRTAPPLEWKKMSNGLIRMPYGARRGDRLNVTQTRRGSGMGKPIRLIDTKIF